MGKALDFLGQEINVGNTVVFSYPGVCLLCKGTVKKVTPKMVFGKEQEFTWKRYHNDVVVIDISPISEKQDINPPGRGTA